MKKFLLKTTVLAFASTLVACGGGGSNPAPEITSASTADGASSNSQTLTGVFIDSAVKGLRWVSGDLEGITDAAGTFQYKAGDNVKFYVGDIFIGDATGDSVIIPVDIVAGASDITDPAVINIVRFLMSLDDDDDPSNGIVISEATANLAPRESINFAQSTADFSIDVESLITTLTSARSTSARTLVSSLDAQKHAEESIKDLLAGIYEGTYSGDDSGKWTSVVDHSGIMTGTVTSNSGDSWTRAVDFESLTSGGVSNGTIYSGAYDRDGTGSGVWNFQNNESGTWSGSKINSI